MSYGAEIYNEDGALVFDGFGCMFLKSTGTTINNITGPIKCITNCQGVLSVRSWINAAYYNFNFANAADCDHVVATSLFQHEQNLYCNNILDTVKDIAFVQIPPEGILHMCMVNYDLPEATAGAAMLVSTGRFADPLQYKIFSTDIPSSSETHGLQLFNEGGGLVFDSRAEILGMEFFEVSTSQVQDILLNNATIDLTLEKPNPNAFVSSSDWTCATCTISGTGCGSFVKITQIDDVTLRLSRQRYGPNTNDNDTTFNDYHPMTLLVARA